jgi:large subunit ribosomal protein L29
VSKVKEVLDRIRDLPSDDLGSALERAREELFRLRLGNYTNQVENTISLRDKRRELARILTITRARALDLEVQAAGGHKRPEPVADAGDHGVEDAAPGEDSDETEAAAGAAKPRGKARTGAKTAAKPPAKPAKVAGKATGKAKPGAKTSKKKSGKE